MHAFTADQQTCLLQGIEGHLPPAQRYSLISSREPQGIVRSNMPVQWQHDFSAQGLHRASPIVAKAKTRMTHYVWIPGDMCSSPVSELAARYDIGQGITFPVRTEAEHFLFSLYFSSTDSPASLYCQANAQHLLFTLFRIAETFPPRLVSPLFTVRELEVLNLLKTGKTYGEIAMILSISERTARFHTANILEKLQATSVRYAIYRAAVKGWI